MNTTILGGQGFIGRHLAARLRASGHACWVPERNDPALFSRPLGLVFYCIGLTANFRAHPFATVDAHVGVLREVLARAQFDQLIYLSSTRVYDGCATTQEDQTLQVKPGTADHLYNLSKLLGESLALSCGRHCRAVRLSNVLGPDMGSTNFVGSVVHDALTTNAVHFKTALASAKDYLWIDDAVSGLLAIANTGRHTLYNLASGANLSHAELAACLAQLGVAVTVDPEGREVGFPVISTKRLQEDTSFVPAPVQPALREWLTTALAVRSTAFATTPSSARAS